MIEYQLITGNKEEVEKRVNSLLNDGWVALDLTSSTVGSTLHYTQAMTKTAETPKTKKK